MKKYITPDKRVWAVDNFLSEEELLAIDNHIENAEWGTIEGWDNYLFFNNTSKFQDHGFIKRKADVATDYQYDWRCMGIIMRIPEGKKMQPHVDHYNVPEEFEKYDFLSATLYLNDNFKGGELYYSNLNIDYTPKRGSIVFHPGFNDVYEHGVRKVEGGPRYAMGLYGKSLTTKIEIV